MPEMHINPELLRTHILTSGTLTAVEKRYLESLVLHDLPTIINELTVMRDAAESDSEKHSITQAIHHLNMAVPKPVLHVSSAGNHLQGWCPHCGQYIMDYDKWFKEPICCRCGQRVIWKEERRDDS